jgi:hypothetical protein
MTGIEVRLDREGRQWFRAYIYDPDRPGRKRESPTGTYERALERRRRALQTKREAKQAAAERAQAALAKLEKTLRGRTGVCCANSAPEHKAPTG